MSHLVLFLSHNYVFVCERRVFRVLVPVRSNWVVSFLYRLLLLDRFWVWALRSFFFVNFFKLCKRSHRRSFEVLLERRRLYNFNRRFFTSFWWRIRFLIKATLSSLLRRLLANLRFIIGSSLCIEIAQSWLFLQTYFAHDIFLFILHTLFFFIKHRRVISLLWKERIKIILFKWSFVLSKFGSLRTCFRNSLTHNLNWVMSVRCLRSIHRLNQRRSTLKVKTWLKVFLWWSF